MTLSVDRDGSIKLGDLEVFAESAGKLEESVESLVEAGGTHLVVTPNVDQVIDLQNSEALRSAFAAASMRLIDGMPLIVLARLLGAKRPHRHTGADLLPMAVKWAHDRGWRIAITGGDTHVASKAAAALRESYAGADVVNIDFPYISDFADSRSLDVINKLKSFNPDIVFLCLGAPKQEGWFMHWRTQLPHGVYVGAGAAVDFAAGIRRRAPKFIQNVGLEWFWRLLQEPKRLAYRYLVKGPRFLKFMTMSLVRRNQ
ncbi:WecB/TagA/CpsF family glycosyltransferase [Arthrobacter sp. M-10]|uniref:WecB/TagA/CpsF family glycosyltransferase n=1 Tax=Arthrobacter sp. M-10 TaxID=3233037 RepID=UPI003F8EFBF8